MEIELGKPKGIKRVWMRLEKLKKGIIIVLLIGAGVVVISYTIFTILAIFYSGS